MNILIIGCGRVGSRLADLLDSQGHDVAVVDTNIDAFRRLDDEFSGITVCGTAMDMRVLFSAGIESCDAVAVVTTDDNLNITISQIVKQFFGLENVLVRISTPSRERVFRKFGLKTVCPTNLAADTMCTALTQPWEDEKITFENTTLSFICRDTDRLTGMDANEITFGDDTAILGILRVDGGVDLLQAGAQKKMIIQEGDKLILTHISD